MRCLLSVHGDASGWGTQPEDETQRELEAFASFEREAKAAGVLVDQGALHADAPEQAKEWAARIPLVGRGGFDRVEIRPFMGQERS